jgi:hypothetical protein
VALAKNNDFAPLGDGTGMMQNYRGQLGVRDDLHGSEGEVGRYLVELGPVGYLLVWIAKLGLMMVLWRSSKILKKAGRRAASAGALAYALLGLYGSLVFDHIYSSLFFVGFGFIFQEVVQAQAQLKALAGSNRDKVSSATATEGRASLIPAQTSSLG